jgi:hypothetical protein
MGPSKWETDSDPSLTTRKKRSPRLRRGRNWDSLTIASITRRRRKRGGVSGVADTATKREGNRIGPSKWETDFIRR